MDTKTLKDVAVGETVVAAKLLGQGPTKRRLMEMGITRGASIFVRKVAPLGDPIEVTVRGYELSLRKEDAELISVTTENSAEEIKNEAEKIEKGNQA